MRLKSYLHNRPSNTRSRHGKTGTFTPLATAYTRRKLTRLLPSNRNVQNTRNFLTNAENPGSLTFKLLAHPIHTFSFLNKQRKIEKRCLLSQCIITDYNFRCLKSLPFSCLLHQWRCPVLIRRQTKWIPGRNISTTDPIMKLDWILRLVMASPLTSSLGTPRLSSKKAFQRWKTFFHYQVGFKHYPHSKIWSEKWASNLLSAFFYGPEIDLPNTWESVPSIRFPYYDTSGRGYLLYGYGNSGDLYNYSEFDDLEGYY